ncbi:ABC transporter permease [Aerococcus sp. CDC-944-U94]|uniref:ABC transporter permease n=1 Tax=Aerococcus urinae (strain CCUG 59500 / ACS-120-V-Col10a) TaxID=2976812 RepID=UPI00227CBD0A|nr:ABC transporter permease [Aerococcus sp. Group 1]MCY3055444.1 ABC transporter permease [Aerococcus sp. Group 1]MCY3057174.1 ABC transporter permease [Aerococcus sp. Group 1]
MKYIVLNNHFKRFFKEKSYLCLAFLLVFVTLAASVFVVTMDPPKLHIGIDQSAEALLAMNNDHLSIEEIEKERNYYSHLISGDYDAYISQEEGKYKILTVRNVGLKEKLSQLLNEGQQSVEAELRANDNHFKIIISVLTMSSMILSLILYRFYFDDRQGIDKRIYSAGLSTFSYLSQHILFNYLILFTINALACTVLFPVFDLELSGRFYIYLLLLELFAAHFSMALSTATKKNQGALLIGTMLSVLTTLLSGVLFTVKSGSLQEKWQYLFPQYYISKLGEDLDGQVVDLRQALLVILGCIVVFFCTALSIQRGRVEE